MVKIPHCLEYCNVKVTVRHKSYKWYIYLPLDANILITLTVNHMLFDIPNMFVCYVFILLLEQCLRRNDGDSNC